MLIGRKALGKLDTIRKREVSRIHARITKLFTRDGSFDYFLEDNLTLNGTFVNKVKVSKRVLRDMDEVVFGGGPFYNFRDKLVTTVMSSTRYIFLKSIKGVVLSNDINLDEELPDPDDAELCPICYESILKRAKLQCNHTFCRKCLMSWVQECILERKSVVCPICKTPFDFEDLLYGDTKVMGDFVIVCNMDSMIRKLKLKSVRQVMEMSISNEWTEDKRQTFWRSHKLFKNKPDKFLVFCALTGSHIAQVLEYGTDMLRIVVRNLLGNIELQGEELRDEAIYLILKKVFNIPRV